jgi:hypothetical protein
MSPTRFSFVLATVIAFVLAGAMSARPASANDTLTEAVEAYSAAQRSTSRDTRNRTFERSALLFEQLAEQEGGTADLWANAGNAWLQSQSIGRAVLAYRRALDAEPRHARAQQNLQHARSLLPTWVPHRKSAGVLDTFFFWHRTLSRNDRSAIAAVAFLVACLCIAGAIGWRRRALRGAALVPIIIWIGAAGSLVVEGDAAGAAAAVVIVDETVARASDSINAAARFNAALPDGTEIVILEERARFSHVRLANERDGWIPRSSYKLVAE